MISKICIILISTLSAVASRGLYPLFMQCDPIWAADLLGFSDKRTICQSGCLLSSLAMVVNDCQILLPTTEGSDPIAANPASLNKWLQANNGYEDVYGFKWNATAPLGLVFEKFSRDMEELFDAYDMGKRIFLHVRNNNHYVLMTGYGRGAKKGDEVFFVNDPNYDTVYYPQIEVLKGDAAIHRVE